jgi:hypothetical protein
MTAGVHRRARERACFVDLIDPDGRTVERSWAPRLRTRW